MLWLIHILIGIIIGLKFKSPMLIIPLAILSHFILDYIPHWDGFFDKKRFQKTGKASIGNGDMILKFADFFFSAALISYFYFQADTSKIVLGAIMAIVPDLAKIGYLTRLKKRKEFIKYLKFHSDIQNEAPKEEGLVIQSVLFVVFIIIIMHMV